MKRFLRWVFIVVVLLIAGATVTGLLVRHRLLQRPTWYGRPVLDAESRRIAANNADQKLIQTFSAAHRSLAREISARHEHTNQAPATAPSITLELSEDEMNAFFSKWADSMGWKQKLGGYLEDPVIVLEGNELILAATVKGNWNALMSLHFTPRLQSGKLNLVPLNVMAGTLSVPRSYYASYIEKLSSATKQKLPTLRQEAEIDPRGWANSQAVEEAMGELLLHALKDEPADPVLFLPEEKFGHEARRSLPVSITALDISNKILTLTVQPMNADEREALWQHLHGSDQTETALGK